MKLTVVVSTYNKPDWLEKTLWGYACQTHGDFELVVADDGSTGETRARIDRLRSDTGLAIEHLWHEDRGYRRQRILNRAIEAASGDYLLFTDGDCIPRADFVATHVTAARPEHFVSGGYCKLPLSLSEAISREDVFEQRCFDPAWLIPRGLRRLSPLVKLGAPGGAAALLDRVTTTRATWNNCNSAGWKADVVAVNGFDERIQYGGADRELGERLLRSGIRAIQARHKAVVVHLDHERGYAKPDLIAWNRRLRRENARAGTTWTEHGIRKEAAPR